MKSLLPVAAILSLGFLLSGCAVASVGSSVVGLGASAVSTGASVAGSAVSTVGDAVSGDDDDEREH